MVNYITTVLTYSMNIHYTRDRVVLQRLSLVITKFFRIETTGRIRINSLVLSTYCYDNIIYIIIYIYIILPESNLERYSFLSNY